jgi:hypothetical protein
MREGIRPSVLNRTGREDAEPLSLWLVRRLTVRRQHGVGSGTMHRAPRYIRGALSRRCEYQVTLSLILYRTSLTCW